LKFDAKLGFSILALAPLGHGFGTNFEQSIIDTFRAYGRFGWNEGHQESFPYTEVDQSVSIGVDLRRDRWRRKLD
jgi:high affinity Mn2+ porin